MGPARVCVRYMSPVLSSSQNVTIRLTPRQKESAPREATSKHVCMLLEELRDNGWRGKVFCML